MCIVCKCIFMRISKSVSETFWMRCCCCSPAESIQTCRYQRSLATFPHHRKPWPQLGIEELTVRAKVNLLFFRKGQISCTVHDSMNVTVLKQCIYEIVDKKNVKCKDEMLFLFCMEDHSATETVIKHLTNCTIKIRN